MKEATAASSAAAPDASASSSSRKARDPMRPRRFKMYPELEVMFFGCKRGDESEDLRMERDIEEHHNLVELYCELSEKEFHKGCIGKFVKINSRGDHFLVKENIKHIEAFLQS